MVSLWAAPTALIGLLGLAIAATFRLQVDALHELPVFRFLFVTQDGRGAWVSLLVLGLGLLAAAAVSGRPIERWVSALAEHPRLLALAVFGIALLATQVVYRDFPLSMDEYTMEFQARVFAEGHLTGQFPPGAARRLMAPWFVGTFFQAAPDGRIISGYWPGLSLLLAPFVKVGMGFLLNPLLTAGCLWLLIRLARRALGAEAAGWCALFFLASAEVWANGASYYSMRAHLFFNLLFIELLIRRGVLSALAAGVVGSIALSLHNPFPHVLAAAPWLLALVVGPARQWRRAAVVSLGYLPLTLLLVLGWPMLRRSLDRPASAAAAAAPQWSGAKAEPAQKDLLTVMVNPFRWPTPGVFHTRAVNLTKMALWNSPGLLVLAALGAAVVWRRRGDPRAWPLLLTCCSAVLTLVGFLFVPVDQGHGWGFRYFFPVWAALPLLAAAWLEHSERSARAASPLWKPAAFTTAVAALLILVPLRAVQARSFIDAQRRQVPPLDELVPAPDHVLAFIDVTSGYYRADLVRNDPFLRSRVLMAVSGGTASDRRLVDRLFPRAELVGARGNDSVWRLPPPAGRDRQPAPDQ